MPAASTGRRPAGIVLVGLALGAALAAQAPQLQQPDFRSGIDLIEVDAWVVDGEGVPVPDLVASDFLVAVDGEPRPVVEAQFIPLGPPRREPPATAVAAPTGPFFSSNADQPPGRLIVLAIDEESFLFGEGRHVMQAAGAFVDTLDPADRVALLAVPQPGAYIDFTADHDRVRRAVAGLAGRGHPPQASLNIGLFEAYQIAVYGNIGAEEQVVARVCAADIGVVACRQLVRAETRQIVNETRNRTDAVRRELESILEGLRELEGPKALVWVSGGFVIDGAGLTLREVERRAAAARTTLYVVMVDEPLIDLSQRELAPTPRQDRRMQEEGLLAAASLTGGRLLRAGNNPGPLFDRIRSELTGYYLLGVESRPADAERESLAIEVAVRRAGARVRAGRTVRLPPEAAAPGEAERLARMLLSPTATRELPVRVATYAYRIGDSPGLQILTALEVGAPGGLSPLTVSYLLRDPASTTGWAETLPVTPRLASGPDGPVLELSLPIPVEAPGRYILRVAVIDAEGRRGSVEHPVRLERAPPAPVAAGDLLVADQAGSPAGNIRPRVQAQVASGQLLAYTELYAASPEAWERTAVHLEVVADAAGAVLARGAATLETADAGADAGAARRRVTGIVSVAHLPPGRYVARVRAVHGATEAARTLRPFRVTAPSTSGEIAPSPP